MRAGRTTALAPTLRAAAFNVLRVREDFPILRELVHGKPLVYLDSAATSQKPQAVIDAMSRFFLKENANVHRGVHYLSERATDEFEGARATVQRFLNAKRRTRNHLRPRRRRRPSTWWRRATARGTWVPATRCSSRRWSITPTSSRGRCSARRRALGCELLPSTTRASS